MFYWTVIISIFFLFLALELFLLRGLRLGMAKQKEALSEKYDSLTKEESSLKEKVQLLEGKMAGHFFFYELIRKLAPLLSKKEIFNEFCEEIKHYGGVEEIEFSSSGGEGSFEFKFGDDAGDFFSIKTESQKIIGHLPYLSRLLGLCVERIALYDRLQEMSIHDSLTGVYNRRYFMQRFLEEFERSKKFNLNLSFLMADIDYFKRVNDTYGHLVGDAILREITRLIKENIREIDFVARFGGEEFAIILPETDKAGAIMVGERIRSRISQERIRAFDEILTTSISIGVASFPQNTLYSDVLIEAVDKALYKAKSLGRNRICWF